MESSALETMLTSISSGVTGVVGDVLPIAGGVIALVVGINYGWKFFKKMTGART